MKKATLGLNIGMNTVGWSVLDSNNTIQESGVYVFNMANVTLNQNRREFRNIRRNYRRKHHRLERLNQLLVNIGLEKPTDITENPVLLRYKGLTEKLSSNELYAALYNLMKHRGVSYLEDIENANENDRVLQNLNKYNDLKYPCEIQKLKLEKYGFYRGTREINNEILINTFTTSMYVDEAKQILNTQKVYYSEINDDFINKYISLLITKRKYYIGPGNSKSRTNYGVYKTTGETKLNLFDDLRGHCSVYNGKDGTAFELRASGASYTVQYYNLLNDLCNIRVKNRKLSRKKKEEVIDYFKNSAKAAKISAVLKKLYGIDTETITGYRIDKNGKEENHSFEIYRAMKKALDEHGIDINKYSINTLDEIANILTLSTDKENIIDVFKNKDLKGYSLVKDISDNEIEIFINLRLKKPNLFKKWSSYSYRLINEIVPEMLESGDEQYTCVRRLELKKFGSKKINHLYPDNAVEEIYNPVFKRSIKETINIINRLLKKYVFSSIIIQLPRDANIDEMNIRMKNQARNRKNLFDKSLEYANLDSNKLNYKENPSLKAMIISFYKQQGICPICGKLIDINELISNPFAYKLDEILPSNFTFDLSQVNKILIHAECHSIKGINTLYNCVLGNNNEEWSVDKYIEYFKELNSNKFISKKQLDLMLFDDDILNKNIISTSINKNLYDNRYEAKTLIKELYKFFDKQDVEIVVINQAITNYYNRNILGYQPEKNNDYRYCSQDAMMLSFIKTCLDKYNENYINMETGEIYNIEELTELTYEEKKSFLPESHYIVRKKIERAFKYIKVSHKVDKAINKGISNQTIYSTKEKNGSIYVINKLNIYEYKNICKLMLEKPEMFLLYETNKPVWNHLLSIIDMYKDTNKNPFALYLEEHGPVTDGTINNTPIKNLRVYHHKLGSYLDITQKYENSKNKVILESLTPFRCDIYYNFEEKRYYVIPIRMCDCRFKKDKYIIDVKDYENILKEFGILKDNQNLDNVNDNHFEFKFSLYKNDLIKIGNEDDVKMLLFQSKGSNVKNAFTVMDVFDTKKERKIITAKKTTSIFKKYNTDILGNIYPSSKEKLRLEFVLKNDKIN